MTLEEIQHHTRYVRIIDSTCSPTEGTRALIGKELKVTCIDYEDGCVMVAHKGNWLFNFSDVQFLTPLTIDGRKVAIGDWIVYKDNGNEYLVYGYHWLCRGWRIETAKDGNFTKCWLRPQDDLSHFTFKPDKRQALLKKADELIAKANELKEEAERV